MAVTLPKSGAELTTFLDTSGLGNPVNFWLFNQEKDTPDLQGGANLLEVKPSNRPDLGTGSAAFDVPVLQWTADSYYPLIAPHIGSAGDYEIGESFAVVGCWYIDAHGTLAFAEIMRRVFANSWGLMSLATELRFFFADEDGNVDRARVTSITPTGTVVYAIGVYNSTSARIDLFTNLGDAADASLATTTIQPTNPDDGRLALGGPYVPPDSESGFEGEFFTGEIGFLAIYEGADAELLTTTSRSNLTSRMEGELANEITLDCKLKFAKGNTAVSMAVSQLSRDVAGGQIIQNRQTVGTSEEALVLGDVGAGGYFIAINRDSTNFVEIRGATGETDLVKLLPGDVCMFRLVAAAPFAIADTAAVELEYLLIEL